MQLNSHLLKIPEATRVKTLEYLTTTHSSEIEPASSPLEDDDFLVVPHLIQGQLLVYSLMGLSPFSQLIFKFPAHRKKVAQFLQNQVLRVDASKGKRRHQLLGEIRPLIEGYLSKMKTKGDERYLFLSKNELKKEQRQFFGKIERLVKVHTDPFHFPDRYL